MLVVEANLDLEEAVQPSTIHRYIVRIGEDKTIHSLRRHVRVAILAAGTNDKGGP